MDKKLIEKAALFGAGVVVGGGIGVLATYRLVKAKYEALMDEEIASVKASFKLLRKEGDLANPTTVVNNFSTYEAAVVEQGYAEVNDDIDYGEAFSRNPVLMSERFQNLVEAVENEDEDESPLTNHAFISLRDAHAPYVIGVDEFMDDEPDYTKLSITYFEGDDTLIDDGESIIPDHEGTVSSRALTQFGVGTRDENTVYVRNEKLLTDYEVTLDKRSYAQLMGFTPDETPAPKVMRMRDER